MAIKDNQHPFFKPVWRRVAVIAVCFVWAALEFIGEQPFWGVIALGMAGYGYWSLFMTYKPVDPESASPEEKS